MYKFLRFCIIYFCLSLSLSLCLSILVSLSLSVRLSLYLFHYACKCKCAVYVLCLLRDNTNSILLRSQFLSLSFSLYLSISLIQEFAPSCKYVPSVSIVTHAAHSPGILCCMLKKPWLESWLLPRIPRKELLLSCFYEARLIRSVVREIESGDRWWGRDAWSLRLHRIYSHLFVRLYRVICVVGLCHIVLLFVTSTVNSVASSPAFSLSLSLSLSLSSSVFFSLLSLSSTFCPFLSIYLHIPHSICFFANRFCCFCCIMVYI